MNDLGNHPPDLWSIGPQHRPVEPAQSQTIQDLPLFVTLAGPTPTKSDPQGFSQDTP